MKHGTSGYDSFNIFENFFTERGVMIWDWENFWTHFDGIAHLT